MIYLECIQVFTNIHNNITTFHISHLIYIFLGSLTSQIPLPDMPQPPAHMYPPHPHYIPQHHPLMNIPIPPSILKKTSAYATSPSIPTLAPNKEPPGVPPFPPPDLSSDDEDISEEVSI